MSSARLDAHAHARDEGRGVFREFDMDRHSSAVTPRKRCAPATLGDAEACAFGAEGLDMHMGIDQARPPGLAPRPPVYIEAPIVTAFHIKPAQHHLVAADRLDGDRLAGCCAAAEQVIARAQTNAAMDSKFMFRSED